MTSAQQVFNLLELRKKIIRIAYGPKRYSLWEGDEKQVYDYLKIGQENDKIYYGTYNQLGCVEYEIRLNKNNEKYLQIIWSAEEEYEKL